MVVYIAGDFCSILENLSVNDIKKKQSTGKNYY